MRKLILTAAIGVFMLSAAFGQDKEKSNEPDIRIHVEKQYDDQGNVIGIDSTYSLSWSSTDSTINLDSLFESFGFGQNQQFRFNFPNPNEWMGDFNFDSFDFNQHFGHIDSLLKRRSFNHDLFHNPDMNRMMEEMHQMFEQNMKQFHNLFDDDRFKFYKFDPNTGDSLRLKPPKSNPGQKQI